MARHAYRVIVPSHYLKKVVTRWGVPQESLTVVYNSISFTQSISHVEARKKLGLDGVVILTAGRLVPWKGFGLIMNILPELQKRWDAKLIIIGDGPDRLLLESQRERLGLSKSVLMPGSISRDAMALYLGSADIFVLNTGYEGFSHQIPEAMAAGLPVITTNAGGNPEVVRDGVNALVAGYNNMDEWRVALIRLLEKPAERSMLGLAAKSVRDQFSLERMMGDLTRILEDI